MSAAPRHFFLVATEESGDRLGADLMRALRMKFGNGMSFSGVGGAAMEQAGLRSLFPAYEIAIVGFVEIARRLRFLLRRIRETADAVIAANPDVLIIIDSPDFTHRVARIVRKRAPHIPIINYVSPTVWAWRPGRARAMKTYIDHVLALLPFEPQAHQRLQGPPCTYVGHPLLNRLNDLRPIREDEQRRAEAPPLVLMLPGSRRSEVRRLMPIFGRALAQASATCGPFEIVLPTLPHLENMVRELCTDWLLPPRIVIGEEARYALFRQARAALVKSGTVTLELALSGIPMVAAYKVSPLEAAVARRLITIPTVILANLVIGQRAVPEFLLEHCTAKNLAPALCAIIKEGEARARQIKAFTEIDAIMSTHGVAPSECAAEAVMRVIGEERAAR